MSHRVGDRLSGWGARLSFGALLLVFSEWVVWQTPLQFSVLDWIAWAAIYLALAAVMLDLIVRLNINDVFSLLLLAGIYGLVNATLISHITARDLPLSLIVRPLSAQPLAFLGALASFQMLASGRASGPLDFLVALGVGLTWGVWVRWFPIVSDEPIPTVEIGTALAALALLLVGAGVLRLVLPPDAVYRRDDWMLLPYGWTLAGGVLLVALIVGAAQGAISGIGVAIVLVLVAFTGMMLVITLSTRRDRSVLDRITPPKTPNIAAWLILIVPFLVAGWAGYSLPGSGSASPQSDLLFGVLTGFGIIWLPAVSSVLGVRAFIQLARQQS